MVATLVIAHHPLASALVAAAHHVYSRHPCAASRQLCALDVEPDADVDEVVVEALRRIAAADRGQGVLVLTDMAGATPGNIAARLPADAPVRVVAGANLPMVLRALCYGDLALDALAEKAIDGGRHAILGLGTADPG